MTKEIMKQALETFEKIASWYDYDQSVGALASSMYEASCLSKMKAEELRQAIAQAEKQEQDEPICRMRVEQDSVTWYDDKGSVTMHVDSSNKVTNNLQPKQERKPLTDDEFLELLLRKGNSEILHYTTFVGGSIQMQGKIGLLKSAKVIKEFIEAAHGIKE